MKARHTRRPASGEDVTDHTESKVRQWAARVNGETITAHERILSPGNVLCMQQVSCMRELAANDVVKMYCRQTSGAALTMNANAYAPRLAATWLRQAT